VSPAPGKIAERRGFFSERLPNGLRVRVASSLHHLEGRTVIVRVAHNEEAMWRQKARKDMAACSGSPYH
jgi:hypothetical protein